MRTRVPQSDLEHQGSAEPNGRARSRSSIEHFTDGHAQAAAQRKLNELIATSPQYVRQRKLIESINSRASLQNVPLQGYFVHQPSSVEIGTTFESQNIRRDTYSSTYESTKATFGNVPQAEDGNQAPLQGLDSTTTRHHDQAAARAWKSVPDMKISDGLKLAIGTQGQAKEFFAESGTAARSNAILSSRRASIRLKEEGGSLKIPGNANALKRIVPAREVAVDDQHADGLEKITGLASHLCNEVVRDVLGRSRRVVTLAQPGPLVESRASLSAGLAEPVAKIAGYIANTDTDEVKHDQVDAYEENGQASSDYLNLGDAEKKARAARLGVNEYAAPKVGEGFVTRSMGTAALGPAMGARLNLEEYQGAIAALHAADKTVDVAKQQTSAEIQAMRNIWGEHYAGVVAADGGDAVTLENYNRRTEREWELARIFNKLFADFEEFRAFVESQTQTLPVTLTTDDSGPLIRSALSNANIMGEQLRAEYREAIAQAAQSVTTGIALDEGHARSMIHFQMYGSKAGQSFHEQFAGSTANAVTMRIEESASEAKKDRQEELQREARRKIDNITRYTPTGNRGLTDVAEHTKAALEELYGQYHLALDSAGTNDELARIEAEINNEKSAMVGGRLLTLYAHFYGVLKGHRPAQRDKVGLRAVVDNDINTAPTPALLALQALMQNT